MRMHVLLARELWPSPPIDCSLLVRRSDDQEESAAVLSARARPRSASALLLQQLSS